MHPFSRSLGPFCRLVLLLCVVVCGFAASSAQTTFTGKVYSPLGVTQGDPIPNILVFAVDPNFPPPVFSQGLATSAMGQSGCEAQPSLVPLSVLGSALTGADGSYSFSTSGALPNPVTIVIQAGKWRRQYLFDATVVTPGTTNTLPPLVMPARQSSTPGALADLPHIAVVTGEIDAVECIFDQIGIDTKEVTNPSGTGSINFYVGATDGGAASSDYTTANPSPSETTLVTSLTNLEKYDVVMFGCQGTATQPKVLTTANEENIVDFANTGGRVFATHWEYIWLSNIAPFNTAADWLSDAPSAPGTQTATIDTSYPEGQILSDWMVNVGASTTPGQIVLKNTEINTSRVNNPPAQSWVNLNAAHNNASMQFTFDTPIGAAGTPTVSLAYTNVTTSFEQGDPSDTVDIVVTNTSTTPTLAGLTLTLSLPPGLTVTSLTPISPSNWTCDSATLICMNSGLAAGATDSIALQFGIPATATLGQESILASLTGGGLSGSGQCGRVLYNDYHVENISVKTNTVYPKECATLPGTTPGTMTPQEKFLEFSLYNLSNFVSPSTSDLIDIQGPTTLSWANPSAIYYGTPLSSTQLNATATDPETSTTVPGNFVYSPAAGTLLNAGTYSGTTALTATFTPSSTIDYITPSPSTVNLIVMPDPTNTALSISPSNPPAGTTVMLAAIISDPYFSPVTGTVTFYDGTAVLGTSTLDATQTARFSISTFSLGLHNLMACLNVSNNFAASCSAIGPELITIPSTPSPTTTLVASNLDPSVVGQSVTFTATMATTGSFIATPSGSVNFLDGSTVIGSGIAANGVATFSTSTLTAGLHSITAVYAGSATMVGSTSVVLAQQVNTSLTSAGTGFLMTVSPTTFSIAAGASFHAGVTILEFNNFNQPITLRCNGLPAEATCNFGTSTIPATGGSTPVTVNVMAPHSCGTNTPYSAQGVRRGLPILAFVTFLFFARRRRALKGLVLAAVLGIIPAISGCSNCTDLGVKPGVYTFTITATPSSSGQSSVNVIGPNGPVTTGPQSQTMTMNVTL